MEAESGTTEKKGKTQPRSCTGTQVPQSSRALSRSPSLCSHDSSSCNGRVLGKWALLCSLLCLPEGWTKASTLPRCGTKTRCCRHIGTRVLAKGEDAAASCVLSEKTASRTWSCCG